MAEKRLLKIGASISEFEATDTLPAANMPAVSVISPSQITADQDDYNPTGWADADIVRLNFDTGGRAITGFAAWTNTRQKTLINTSGNFGYIPCEHPDSTAANRAIGPCDHIVGPYGSLVIEYDSTSSRTRIVENSFNPAAPGLFQKGHFVSVSPGATLGSDWGSIGFGISGGDNGTNTPTATLPGAWQIHTSTSATGASSIFIPKTVNSIVQHGSAHIVCNAFIYFDTLSDGSQTYTFSFGVTSPGSSTVLDVVNSLIIKYSHGLNSGKFLGVSRDNGGAESTVDLGVTVAANTPYSLTVCFNKARTEVRFYVDGVFSGRITANMPNAAAVGQRAIIVKSAGTTQRNAFIVSQTVFTVF